MNKELVIITSTFNRAGCLMDLYKSLTNQDDKNFTWFVCDDGSSDTTEEVVSSFIEAAIINITYVKKENTGKSRTLNFMFDKIQDFEFALIVDDDESLYPDAVSTVKQYIDKYKNSNCGMIHFNRNYFSGEVISNFTQKDDFIMTFPKRRKMGYMSDGYVGYFVKRLNDIRFPVFEGEKYVAPSVLMMLLSKRFELLWAKPSLGETEYRADGITKSGRKMRLKNPCSMAYHALLMQEKEVGLKYRIIYSILGYSYLIYSRHNINDIKDKNVSHLYYIRICMPIAFLVAIYWKWLYKAI